VRSWQAAYAGLLPAPFLEAMDVEINAAKFRERLSSATPLSEDWLLEVDGVVVGWANCLSMTRDPDGEASVSEIAAIYLVPSVWGQGLGLSMLTCLVDGLAEAGTRVVTLWVLESNQRARRFYERQGFVPDGLTKEVSIVEGVVLNEVRYRRAL